MDGFSVHSHLLVRGIRSGTVVNETVYESILVLLYVLIKPEMWRRSISVCSIWLKAVSVGEASFVFGPLSVQIGYFHQPFRTILPVKYPQSFGFDSFMQVLEPTYHVHLGSVSIFLLKFLGVISISGFEGYFRRLVGDILFWLCSLLCCAYIP